MKQRFVPLEKSSKRNKKAYHAAKRITWGEINPVTRKTKNPKAYDRKKNRQWNEFGPMPVFLLCGMDKREESIPLKKASWAIPLRIFPLITDYPLSVIDAQKKILEGTKKHLRTRVYVL